MPILQGGPTMSDRLHTAFRQLRSSLDEERSDAEYLDRFTTDHDELAFAAVVRRHGPLVRGVCRRVLGESLDADDAFQVTFLVLAARAAVLRPRKSLGPWLYRVARHVALRAYHNNARRQSRERQAPLPARPDPV